jgi:hypothetical protein
MCAEKHYPRPGRTRGEEPLTARQRNQNDSGFSAWPSPYDEPPLQRRIHSSARASLLVKFPPWSDRYPCTKMLQAFLLATEICQDGDGS